MSHHKNRLVNHTQILPDPTCVEFYVLAVLWSLSAPLSIQGASLGFPASTGFFLSGHKPVAVQGCVLKLILSDEFTSVPDSIRKEKELFLLGLFSL